MIIKEIFSWIKSILISVILAFIIINYILSIVSVDGPSMEPTLYNGDKLLLLKFPLFYREINIGEIAVFQSPINFKSYYIKRIIAKENDEVKILDGRVYVNGKLIEEEYIKDNAYTETAYESQWIVEKNHYFVMGDNRGHGKSTDSRYFGTIEKESIVGIARSRIFPFNKFEIELK